MSVCNTILVGIFSWHLQLVQINSVYVGRLIFKIIKDKTVSEISKMSHKEEAWKKTKRYENISFEYAMNLKILKNI